MDDTAEWVQHIHNLRRTAADAFLISYGARPQADKDQALRDMAGAVLVALDHMEHLRLALLRLYRHHQASGRTYVNVHDPAERCVCGMCQEAEAAMLYPPRSADSAVPEPSDDGD